LPFPLSPRFHFLSGQHSLSFILALFCFFSHSPFFFWGPSPLTPFLFSTGLPYISPSVPPLLRWLLLLPWRFFFQTFSLLSSSFILRTLQNSSLFFSVLSFFWGLFFPTQFLPSFQALFLHHKPMKRFERSFSPLQVFSSFGVPSSAPHPLPFLFVIFSFTYLFLLLLS